MTEPDFWKKFLIRRYQTLIFFFKTAQTFFLAFGLTLVLNMNFNLYETYFWEKKIGFGDMWPRNCQKVAIIEVFDHFPDSTSLVFLGFAHNDRLAWCLVFLQFDGPVNVLLFCSTKCMDSVIIRFKMKIIEKPHSFAPRHLIFKLQQEVLKFINIFVSCSSPKLTWWQIF